MAKPSFLDPPPWAEKLERWGKSRVGRQYVAVVCFILAGFLVFQERDEDRLRAGGYSVQAIVNRVNKGRSSYAYYNFVVDGATYKGHYRVGRREPDSLPAPGATIKVWYDKANPNENVADLGGAGRTIYTIILLVSLCGGGLYHLAKSMTAR